MEKKICPQCHSNKWMTGLKTHGSEVVLCAVKETALQSAKGLGRVQVEACGECGYVQYSLERPQDVYEEWRKHNT
jgi:ribosomal protein S27AE